MAQTFSVRNDAEHEDYNDLYLDSYGNIAIAVDQEAVLQDCAHAAKTILGEMVLQTNIGIPNFQTAWAGVPNILQYEAAVRVAILNVPGVLEIVSFRATFSANILNYVTVIRTVYGEGQISG